eukprot:2131517-Amphidinium_carterae.1
MMSTSSSKQHPHHLSATRHIAASVSEINLAVMLVILIQSDKVRRIGASLQVLGAGLAMVLNSWGSASTKLPSTGSA